MMGIDDILFQGIMELEQHCWVFSDWNNNPNNEGVPLLSYTSGEDEDENDKSSQSKEEKDDAETTEPSSTSDNVYVKQL